MICLHMELNDVIVVMMGIGLLKKASTSDTKLNANSVVSKNGHRLDTVDMVLNQSPETVNEIIAETLFEACKE